MVLRFILRAILFFVELFLAILSGGLYRSRIQIDELPPVRRRRHGRPLLPRRRRRRQPRRLPESPSTPPRPRHSSPPPQEDNYNAPEEEELTTHEQTICQRRFRCICIYRLNENTTFRYENFFTGLLMSMVFVYTGFPLTSPFTPPPPPQLKR